MILFVLFALVLLTDAARSAPWSVKSYLPKTPRKKTWKAGELNVHFVPHTHDDVGWLKTVDQYYVGQNNTIQHAGVQFIIDSIVQELLANPDRKFIYVEQAFFQRWWRQQNAQTQANVQMLVSQGRLEFVNGGWCMHDEAAAHYVAMVDQTTVGHRFIKQQFNAVPTVGWQIDPFGHSSTQAALLSAKTGFNALFFGRIDYQDRQVRIEEERMEFVWRASPAYGVDGQVFAGAFWDGNYQPPPGFCFDDVNCADPPMQDDPRLEDYNVQDRVNDFVEQCYDLAETTLGNDIMLKFGSDFNYENGHTYFKNLDKLIQHANEDGRVNAFYSTPSQYVAAKVASNITWTLKTDDFFPYADCDNCMWTGYFTSRPSLKRNIRAHSNFLNTAKQLDFFQGGNGSSFSKLDEEVAVSQHHDGVSGTAKQHVTYDYAQRISDGLGSALNASLSFLANSVANGGPVPALSSCWQLNETYCAFSQTNAAFAVIIYNPQHRARSEYVRIPLANNNAVQLFDANGFLVSSELLPTIRNPVPNITPAPYHLSFLAQLPALGYTTYFVQPDLSEPKEKEPEPEPLDTITLENAYIAVNFDNVAGVITSITDKLHGITTPLSQDWLYYSSYDNGDQNSGAYIFRPKEMDPTQIPKACGTATPVLKLITNAANAIQEVRQDFCDYLTQTVRLVGDQPHVEIEYNIGSIPITDYVGKEIISRFTTNLASNSTVYTDSNGREMQTRIYNYRPTWDYTVYQPIAGNYYPVNGLLYINDTTDKRQFTVLNDRSQGGASVINGTVEIMVHRRILEDDGRGVGEPLNETQSITPYPTAIRIGPGMGIVGKLYLVFNVTTTSSEIYRPLQSRIFSEPLIAFAPMEASGTAVKDWIGSHRNSMSFAASSLPPNVELMTLQPWDANTVLLRLSHQFGLNEDPTLSLPVQIDLDTLFSTFTITSATEVSLTANQNMSTFDPVGPRLRVKGEEYIPRRHKPKRPSSGANVITLNPMDIKTYVLNVQPKTAPAHPANNATPKRAAKRTAAPLPNTDNVSGAKLTPVVAVM